MQNFEFQVNFSGIEELSLGLEHRLKKVSELPIQEVQEFNEVVSQLPSEILSGIQLKQEQRQSSSTEIEEKLKKNGLTSAEGINCYVSETVEGQFITYFLRRLKSENPNIIGTHRMNFQGDVRKKEALKPFSEIATITDVSENPRITWFIQEYGKSLKELSSKLIEKKVYEIPFNDIPAEFESIIWAGSSGTKSHGH